MIAPIRSPSSSPPCDGECSVHPSTTKIAYQHPSTDEIDPHPRAPIPPPWAPIHMTHPCPISLFLDLPLSFPHLLITLSSSSPFDRDFGVNKCFCLVLFWFLFVLSLYIEIFYYEICLETEKIVEKMWETSKKIAFSKHNQTLENIFQSIFWNVTKHLKIFSPENILYSKNILHSIKRLNVWFFFPDLLYKTYEARSIRLFIMLHESTLHKRGPTVHFFTFCVFVW